MLGLQHAVPRIHKHRTSYFKSTLTFLLSDDIDNEEIAIISVFCRAEEMDFQHLAVPGSTLYVGLQHALPPTNTKFKPLHLLTGIRYTTTYNQTALYFKSTLTFLGLAKRWKSISASHTKPENSCDFFHIQLQVIFQYLFRRDFSVLRVQLLITFISICSYFPEVRAFGTLNTSTKVFLGL